MAYHVRRSPRNGRRVEGERRGEDLAILLPRRARLRVDAVRNANGRCGQKEFGDRVAVGIPRAQHLRIGHAVDIDALAPEGDGDRARLHPPFEVDVEVDMTKEVGEEEVAVLLKELHFSVAAMEKVLNIDRVRKYVEKTISQKATEAVTKKVTGKKDA